MKRRIDDLYNDQGGKGGGPGSKSKRQTPVQPSGRKNEDNMLAPSRPLGIGEQIATRFPSPNLYPGNVVQSETGKLLSSLRLFLIGNTLQCTRGS